MDLPNEALLICIRPHPPPIHQVPLLSELAAICFTKGQPLASRQMDGDETRAGRRPAAQQAAGSLQGLSSVLIKSHVDVGP